jgi:chitodextrinase
MRRPFRWLIAFVAWTFIAVGPAQAAGPGTTTTDGLTTITGVLRVLHADDFAHGTARFVYGLRSATGWLDLDFPQTGPMDDGGATVQVTGRFEGGRLRVATDAADHGFRIIRKAKPLYQTSGQTFHHDSNGVDVPDDPGAGGTTVDAADPELLPTDAATAAAATPVTVAVILLNFSNDATQPYAAATANGIMFSNPTSVANYFAEESRGAVAMSGHVYGWYTVAATNASCNTAYSTWESQADAMAAAAGVDLSSFDRVVYAWPYAPSCGWAGMGYMPGPTSWNNGSFDLRVLAHELSHNFGTNHASTLQCTQGTTIVALSATCTYTEYGDPFSVMGSANTYHSDSEQVGEMGWLKAGELATVAPGGTYAVTPLLTGAAGAAKVLRIVRTTGPSASSFFVDVRATVGPYFDTFGPTSAAVTGVMIRLSTDSGVPMWAPTNTKLVDATPNTSTYTDAPLTVGNTVTDPVSHISITTISVDASGALIRVTESVPPTAPGGLTGVASGARAMDLSWSAATDNVAVTGYRLQRDGADLGTVGPSVRSFHDTGLTAETAYHYTVVAFDGSGNDGPTAAVDVTTPPDDTVAPTAPTNLVGIPSTTTVALSWTAGTDDQHVAGYRVSRNGVAVATVTGTTWTDTKRAPKTTYLYDVVTLDGAANPSPVASISVLTKPDTTKPSRPTGLRATTYHSVYTTLTFKAGKDDVGVAGYRIYRVGRTSPVATTTKLSLHVKRVKGALYYVRAFDAAGNLSKATPNVKSP